MASDKAFVESLIAGLWDARVYPMMGDYILYCREKTVGCICDNALFVKITPASRRILEPLGAPELPPYLGAKPRYRVDNTEKAFLQELLFAIADDLPQPKKRK